MAVLLYFDIYTLKCKCNSWTQFIRQPRPLMGPLGNCLMRTADCFAWCSLACRPFQSVLNVKVEQHSQSHYHIPMETEIFEKWYFPFPDLLPQKKSFSQVSISDPSFYLTPFLYCLGPKVAEPKKWFFPNFIFKGWEWCI